MQHDFCHASRNYTLQALDVLYNDDPLEEPLEDTDADEGTLDSESSISSESDASMNSESDREFEEDRVMNEVAKNILEAGGYLLHIIKKIGKYQIIVHFSVERDWDSQIAWNLVKRTVQK